jgi:hypothetical protein
MVEHSLGGTLKPGGSSWSDDFERALQKGGVDTSGYRRTSSGGLASPAVIARDQGFDAVVRRYPDTVYENAPTTPGNLIVTAFDLDSLRVIREEPEGGWQDDPGAATAGAISVPDAPEMHGVSIDSDPGLFQRWRSEVREQTGQLVRGTVLDPYDPRIPDTLYHATTDLPTVFADGFLRARGAGGLGGDESDKIASLTTNPEIAARIAADMRLLGRLHREVGPAPPMTWDAEAKEWDYGERPEWGKKVRNFLRDEAERQGFEFGVVDPTNEQSAPFWEHMEQSGDMSVWMNQWFASRETKTGAQNPIIFRTDETAALLDPDRIGVVEVPREALRSGALVMDFDWSRGRGLDEIRVYGDVAVLRPDGGWQAPAVRAPDGTGSARPAILAATGPVQNLLEALEVPEAERAGVVDDLLALGADQRVALTEEWLQEDGRSLAEVLDGTVV